MIGECGPTRPEFGGVVRRKDGTVGNPLRCIDWPEAFDACRERDRPTVCIVTEPGGEFEDPDGLGTITLNDRDVTARCFPSGRFERLGEVSS